MDTLQKLAEGTAEMARQLQAEKQMVELLFVINHIHHPETEALLTGAQAALAAAGKDATGPTKLSLDYYQKRLEQLLSIKKTGFKPTVH